MPLVIDPSWTAYTRALARLADAGQRLDLAQASGAAVLAVLERDFQEALRAYDAAREQMDRARSPDSQPHERGSPRLEMDGQVVRIAGLVTSRGNNDVEWDSGSDPEV